jgi:hypothetical protein
VPAFPGFNYKRGYFSRAFFGFLFAPEVKGLTACSDSQGLLGMDACPILSTY